MGNISIDIRLFENSPKKKTMITINHIKFVFNMNIIFLNNYMMLCFVKGQIPIVCSFKYLSYVHFIAADSENKVRKYDSMTVK